MASRSPHAFRHVRPFNHSSLLQRQAHTSQHVPSLTCSSPHIYNVEHHSPASLRTIRHHGTSTPHSPSVSPTEISHFSALASTWWDPYGSSRLLHLMNPLRHDFITSCLSSSSSASNTSSTEEHQSRKLHYLDVGCGGGIFTESAARLLTTASVTGIDPSAEVIGVAKAHARRDPGLNVQDQISTTEPSSSSAPPLIYLNTSLESLSSSTSTATTSKDKYDILTLFEVLEHTTYPSDFLAHTLPLIRPGGWLILSTITRSLASYLTHKLVAEDLLRIVPRGTHDWNKFLKVEEVRGWFGKQDGWGGKWVDGNGFQREGVRSVGVVYVDLPPPKARTWWGGRKS